MTDMRHRDGKLKTMHTIIGEYGKTLRQIAALDTVESILTGTISPLKGYKETLTFQYFTDNGLKLLARTTTAVQEIFIVTQTPDVLLDELYKAGFVEQEREDVRHGKSQRKKNRRTPAQSVETGPETTHSLRKGKTAPDAPLRAADPLTLSQMLDGDVLAKLQKVKESATPKPQLSAPANIGRKGTTKSSSPARVPAKSQDDEGDFASLFEPEQGEESFADLLNKSKLDPKYFGK